MSLSVTICDDSSFARKSMVRSLPVNWDVSVSFAEDGSVAIEKIKQGLAHVLFLDLNMPVMDGYQTLEEIRKHDLPTIVIVVSGDVQEEARRRVKAMGALDFIEKPINKDKLLEILATYGIYEGDGLTNKHNEDSPNELSEEYKLDMIQEMSNVAMGRAGKSLASTINVFVDLPVPNVSIIHASELAKTVQEIDSNEYVSAVSKGFIGSDVRGEAIILFNHTSNRNMKELLGYGDSQSCDVEVLMDVSNMIVGACLSAIAEQLGSNFTHTTPNIVGLDCGLHDIVAVGEENERKLLMVEIAYSIKSANVNFELLLLMPSEKVDKIIARLTKQGA